MEIMGSVAKPQKLEDFREFLSYGKIGEHDVLVAPQ